MFKNFATTSLIVLAASGTVPSFAQDADTTKTATTASVTAQSKDSGVSTLVSGVTESANRLQASVDRFENAMKDASQKDAGMKALDEMLVAARGVNESLNKDSETWGELQGLIDMWTKKRDSVIERAKSNPSLQPLAALWQEKVDRVIELRTAILDQAADSELLITDIENKKEVIAEYYELDKVDLVLAEMEVMNDELTSMNQSMQLILEKTTGVEEQKAPTTN